MDSHSDNPVRGHGDVATSGEHPVLHPAGPSRFPSDPEGIRVSVRHEGGATVVSLEGVAGTETPDAVVAAGLPVECPTADVVIVDLSNLTLLDGDAVRRLLGKVQAMWASSGRKVRVVCRRSTGRSLLRAWRLHERFPIFPSLGSCLGADLRPSRADVARRSRVGVLSGGEMARRTRTVARP
ncbi:MAG: STAS domain-containing protein [Actinobacteria bacterium]|nr:STAS domain-containing protein [Actinomycetota bacterium]